MKNGLLTGGENPGRVVDMEDDTRKVCILVLKSVTDEGTSEELEELVAAARGLKHWEMEKVTVLVR